MNITIFGAGYVGLSTAVCLAKKNNVNLVDIDGEKIKSIESGDPIIYEEGLEELLKEGLSAGRIKGYNITEKIPPAEIIVITVGTPSDSDGYINLQYVRDVVKTINQRKREICDPNYCLIVLRSTVVPGTTRRFLNHLQEKDIIGIAFNPEFLSQGSAIKDTLNPSRIIIGSDTERSSQYLEKFYKEFFKELNIPIIKMSIESAEFAKYAANTLLATKISFVNELANLVETVEGADIGEIMESVGFDPRISPKFLQAGIGFGGSCFPKDLKALIQFTEDSIAEKPILLSAVLQVNENRPLRITKLLRKHLGDLNNKSIAVLGLAFKPETNDVRETPAISVIRSLWRNGVEVKIHDPLLNKIDTRPFKKFNVKEYHTIEECVRGSHACIILTEWSVYKKLNIEKLTEKMQNKLIVDGRRIFSNRIKPPDVQYYTIGSSDKIKKT